MKITLQQHLIKVFVTLTFLPLLLVSILFSYLTIDSIKGEALKHEQVVAKRISSEVNLFIGGLSKELHVVANDLLFFNKDRQQQMTIIGSLLSHDNLYNKLTVLNIHGDEELKISLTELVDESDLRSRRNEDVFLIPCKTKEIYYSPIWINEINGEPLLNVAVPSIDLKSGKVVGVLVAEVLFKRIWVTLADIPIRKGEDIYIVDNQQRLIAHRNPSLVLKNYKFKLPESDGYYMGLNNTDVAIAVNTIVFGNQAFNVVAEIEKKEALQLAYKTIWAVGIFIFVVLLSSFFVALYTARRIGRPLSVMANVALEIGNGARDKKAPSSDYEELSNLSIAFNSMTEELQQALVSLHNEIIERGKLESDLLFTKFAVDHSSDAAFWIDSNGKFQYVNEVACKKLGYTQDELLSMCIYDIDPLFPADGWPAHWEELKHRGSLTLESQHRTKNGVLFPVEVSANFIEYEDKAYNCAFVRDLSDRKKAEKERLRMESQLQQSQKMEAVGTLAGGIAHDFNNILAAIMGYTELAKRSLQAENETDSMLTEVLKASERAKKLVQQILAFSRKADENRVPLQVHLVVKEALKLLRSSIPTTIEIREKIDSSGIIVIADPTQIHQIVMNLCTNAYHAMRERGGILSVNLSAAHIDKNDDKLSGEELVSGDYLKLTVSDTGQGIEQSIIERIFDPYFTTKKQGEGTGLGLATVHGIVKSLGGHISVDSELGHGTAFEIYLPVATEVPGAQITKPSIEGLPRGHERILFVDDEEVIAELGHKMLTNLGYHVRATTNSEEAIALFLEKPESFDLVITDMTMPVMTGAELSQKILELRPDVPIILCTGYSELLNEEKAKAIGIREYVTKPINQMHLANVIRKVLDSV